MCGLNVFQGLSKTIRRGYTKLFMGFNVSVMRFEGGQGRHPGSAKPTQDEMGGTMNDPA